MTIASYFAPSSPAEVARSAEIVFLCLTDSAAVEQVVFGSDGLAAAPGGGRVVVEAEGVAGDLPLPRTRGRGQG